MKPAVDEMFPEGAGPYVDLDEAGGSTGLLMDLAANEKAVHADFFNGFQEYEGVAQTQPLAPLVAVSVRPLRSGRTAVCSCTYVYDDLRQ
ncbi:COP9 signalosome complex subunit 9 isoform X1 [Marmota flaviventris]|uniref:COP9 signalosome complex subunit 9 isoform X1 n=1 Tax=Marmota flaviventris TaxID=93162 RepID=UPI003A86770B